MHKRIQFLFILLVMTTLAVTVAPFALAQDAEEELVCPAFEGSATDLRTGYYMGEGAAYLTSGQPAAAIHSYSCIIEQIDSSFVEAYFNRAVAFTMRRDFEKAMEDYTSAISLDSILIPAINNRGIIYVAQEEYDLALADFDRIVNMSSSPRAYINRGIVYAIQDNFPAAIADLQQAIDVSGIESVVTELNNPERPRDAEPPEFDREHAQAYAILGIIYSDFALANYDNYNLLNGSRADRRIQSAAGALESRFTFELRLEDGTWFLVANFAAA